MITLLFMTSYRMTSRFWFQRWMANITVVKITNGYHQSNHKTYYYDFKGMNNHLTGNGQLLVKLIIDWSDYGLILVGYNCITD